MTLVLFPILVVQTLLHFISCTSWVLSVQSLNIFKFSIQYTSLLIRPQMTATSQLSCSGALFQRFEGSLCPNSFPLFEPLNSRIGVKTQGEPTHSSLGIILQPVVPEWASLNLAGLFICVQPLGLSSGQDRAPHLHMSEDHRQHGGPPGGP